MKIIYNPLTGAPIEKFVHQEMGKLDPHPVGELRQYPESVAQDLLDTYGFLEELTPEQASSILKKPQGEFKCDQCDYVSDKHIGLLGHRRKHGDVKVEAKEEVKVEGIPVAKGTPVEPRIFNRQDSQDKDLVGADWYGPGLTQD